MTGLTLVTLLAVIAILILCSALFSAVETALFLLKPHQLRRLEAHHAGLTKFIQLFRENPRRVLNVLLLGDGLVNVVLVVLCLFFLWEGALYGGEAEMIQEIMKLGDKTAKDCMTPRVDSFMLSDDLTNEDAIARLKEKRHRRVPVYADTPDQILGIIDVKLFLLDPSEHYTEKLIAPSFIPETMRAVELLKLFLTHPQGMGVVVDEFGGTEGIITMEDIVEEILSGTVPRDGSEFYIEPLGNGKFLVSGNARLDDLTEHLGFQIDAEGIDTIGGFVFTRLGHVPSSGTKLKIPGLAITVRRAARKRIEEVLLERTTNAFEEVA